MRDAILLKPGKLTDDEYELMKKHTTIGYDALRSHRAKLGESTFLRLRPRDRGVAPRALGRRGLPERPPGDRDPGRRPPDGGRRRLRRPGQQARLQTADAARARRWRSSPRAAAASSTPTWSTPFSRSRRCSATSPAPSPTTKRSGGCSRRPTTRRAARAAGVLRRVLLVDDNAINREIMFSQLTSDGYLVQVAENGRAALELYRARRLRSRPDRHRDARDGRLRAGGEHPAAWRRRADIWRRSSPSPRASSSSSAEKARAHGFTGYMLKPLDLDLLERKLADLRLFFPGGND